MKLFFSIFFFLVLFSSCRQEVDLGPEWVWDQHIDSEEITRTVIRYSARMDRAWRLKLEDSRIYYTEQIEKIRLVYASQAILDVEESRRMVVDFVEGLLNALNNNPSIRADMYRAPFTAEDLELYFSLESYFGQYIDPFMVGWIEVVEGMATYYMDSLKDEFEDNWHYRAEPYFKAREIVMAEKEAALLFPTESHNLENVFKGDIEGSFIDIPDYRNTPSRGRLAPKAPVTTPAATKPADKKSTSVLTPTPTATATPTAQPVKFTPTPTANTSSSSGTSSSSSTSGGH